ncbi:MAG: peptide deformylase [Burkholderiales bacterium]
MALLPILQYPDPRLYTVAVTISAVNDEIRRLIRNMAETMYAAPGVGLAATQVDDHRRLIIVDISETHDQLQVFINPEILSSSGAATCEEGCLSVPGIFEKVARAETISVGALDAQGRRFTLDAEGLLAVCIQHEMDHLDGKVFVDYLSRLKQQRILARLKKQKRQVM